MATFYGQVEGQAQTVAARRGSENSGIRASVQSWNGSVITRLWYDDDGILWVRVSPTEGSRFCSDGRLPEFWGTFDELIECFDLWKNRNVVEVPAITVEYNEHHPITQNYEMTRRLNSGY